MNFREFVNSDRKPQHQYEPEELYETVDDDQEYIEEPEEPNDDFDDEDEGDEEYYEPEPEPSKVIPARPQRVAQRPVQRQVQRPVQRPMPQRVVRPQAQYRPVRQAMPVEQYNRPIQINKKQLTEETIEGTANSLTEALKRKVDTIFYRFGIQGLEKLDEKILDTIEELQYPEAKQVKKPGVNMRRVPAKRVVKRPKPLPIQDIKPVPQQYEPEEEYYDEPAPVYEDVQEPVEEIVEQEPVQEQPVQEPVEEKPQTMANILESMGDSMKDIAGQLLNIDPTKELKHEPKGNNPVFAPPEPIPVRTPSEPKDVPLALEVLPVQNQFITMPDLTETKEETPAEQPAEQPVEKPKKTRKSKKKDEEVTNEEK